MEESVTEKGAERGKFYKVSRYPENLVLHCTGKAYAGEWYLQESLKKSFKN
ncbi:MAG TPA: hypothetical protein VHO43_07710 [Ignavibacteriales bacterium]|nr:hypothetical protein [Ignavibacteriales bacterium]